MAFSKPGRQRGMALLFAVLIVVIASAIAVSMIHAEKFTIRKTAHIQTMDRASLYALGLEDWARIYIKQDREDSEIDHLDEDWAIGIPGLPIEGGYLSGYLEDEQAKFNLNSLIGSELAVIRFRRLCNNLEVEETFIPALMDWTDADFDVRYPDGAEEHYENYRVANRPMVDITELLLVEHVTVEIFEKLRPFITVLAPPTTINVNTMSETLYESLGEGLNASRFTEEREDDAFASIDDFVERLQLPIETEGLSVNTSYFRAHGQVVQGEMIFNLESLVFRDSNGKTLVVSRTLGQF
jgi:general secretion pathway protein K